MAEEGGSHDMLARWLDDLRARLDAARRRRSPEEAPLRLTRAYVDLLFAVGHARLGGAERVSQLVERARQAMREHLSDPVHRCLVSALTVRADQMLAGIPPRRSLPGSVLDEIASLDRVARVKVDTFRRHSRLIDPETPDPLGDFSKRILAPVVASPPPREPTNHAAELEARLERGDVATIVGCLDEVYDVPGALAEPIVARAIELAVPTDDARALAEAIGAATWFGYGELVARPLHTFCAVITRVDAWPDTFAVMRALRSLDLRSELAEVVRALASRIDLTLPIDLEPLPRDHPQIVAAPVALACAGALAQLDDPGGPPAFRAAHAFLERRKQGHEFFVELARATADGWALAPDDAVLPGLERLERCFPLVTDRRSVNSHYSMSVIDFVDALIDAALLRVRPRYPPASR